MNVIDKIKDIINQAEKFKNVYFWAPEGSAGARRSMEKRESRPVVKWTDGKDTFTAEFVVTCTCSHTEARGIYTRNGKRTTLVAVRNSLKRLDNTHPMRAGR